MGTRGRPPGTIAHKEALIAVSVYAVAGVRAGAPKQDGAPHGEDPGSVNAEAPKPHPLGWWKPVRRL